MSGSSTFSASFTFLSYFLCVCRVCAAHVYCHLVLCMCVRWVCGVCCRMRCASIATFWYFLGFVEVLSHKLKRGEREEGGGIKWEVREEGVIRREVQ